MARTIAKDYDQKRQMILQKAAKVFATQGFDRSSMSDLAIACGISKANIYHYYDSKDALLFDILHCYLQALRDRVCAVDTSELSPSEGLYAVILETLLAYQGSDSEHRLQIRRYDIMPATQQKVLRSFQRDMIRKISDIIATLAPHRFEHDAPALRATTMSIFGMLNWFYMWNTKSGTKAREEYARQVTDLTLNGIAGPKS